MEIFAFSCYIFSLVTSRLNTNRWNWGTLAVTLRAGGASKNATPKAVVVAIETQKMVSIRTPNIGIDRTDRVGRKRTWYHLIIEIIESWKVMGVEIQRDYDQTSFYNESPRNRRLPSLSGNLYMITFNGATPTYSSSSWEDSISCWYALLYSDEYKKLPKVTNSSPIVNIRLEQSYYIRRLELIKFLREI